MLLTTTLTSYDSKKPTTAVLATTADYDVSCAAVTVHGETLTTTCTAGLVPIDSNHQPIDRIRLRWVGHTGSWTGNGASTCAWTNATCIGSVGLWR